jgi:hypothetical protein
MKALMLRTALCGVFFGVVNLLGTADAVPNGVPGDATGEYPLLYSSDFADGKAEEWHPTDPDAWKVVRRGDEWVYAVIQPCRYKPPVRSPWNVSVLRDPAVTDFVLEVRLRSTTKDYNHRDMCIVFGYQDPEHFYYAHLGKRADPHSNSVFIVNGTPRVSIAASRTEGTPWDDEEHRVRVRRETGSGLIEVLFDDHAGPVMRATDKTFLWGLVGVGAFDDLGEISEVRLWGVEAPGKESRLF